MSFKFLEVDLLITLFCLIAPNDWVYSDPPNSEDTTLPHYVCYRTETPLHIDGKLEESVWSKTKWTEDFSDIQGDQMPKPHLRTRAKMLWDDHFLYIGAELEEPHVWATFTERESIIFHENNFEIFIDPDGDTHQYYELEINVLGTVWDLMLVKPYRDGGPAISAWDIRGLKTGVHIEGTINNPGDKDRGWSVEIALPWEVLKECAPEKRAPLPGEQWRVNFSRVEWQLEHNEKVYVKKIDPKSQKPYPEYNWVWSPTGRINMHMPEMWGYVQFSQHMAGSAADSFLFPEDEKVKQVLRQLYYHQRAYFKENGHHFSSLQQIGTDRISIEGLDFKPEIMVTDHLYEISHRGFSPGVTWHIRQDGLIWATHTATDGKSK